MARDNLNPVEYMIHDAVINHVRVEFGLSKRQIKYVLLLIYVNQCNPRRFSRKNLNFVDYRPYGILASFQWAKENGFIVRVARNEYMFTEKLYRIANRLEIFYNQFKEKQIWLNQLAIM